MRVGVGNMEKGKWGGEHGDGRHGEGEMGMEGGMGKCQGHAEPGGLDVSSLEIHCGSMQVSISHLSSMRV